MRTEAEYGFTTEPYSGGGRQKQYGFMSHSDHGIIMQEDIMSTIQEMGNTIATLNAVVSAMQSENRMLRTLAPDPLGVVGPQGWPKKVGFMDINTMQTTPCDCRSFTDGLGEGIGIGVGIGVAVAVGWGILSLLKSR